MGLRLHSFEHVVMVEGVSVAHRQDGGSAAYSDSVGNELLRLAGRITNRTHRGRERLKGRRLRRQTNHDSR